MLVVVTVVVLVVFAVFRGRPGPFFCEVDAEEDTAGYPTDSEVVSDSVPVTVSVFCAVEKLRFFPLPRPHPDVPPLDVRDLFAVPPLFFPLCIVITSSLTNEKMFVI
jgi:hypothetical protein